MKIISFIKNRPGLTIWIFTFIAYLINAVKTGNPNPAGFFILGLFLTAAATPFIRKAINKKEKKKDMDYLAKRIAEEQKK